MAPRSKIKEKLDKRRGKVSSLKPKAKKKEPAAKKKVVAKKKPDAKAPAKRVVKKVAKKVAKATAKKVVVPPVSPNLFRTMIGFGVRAIAPVAAAVTGTSLAAPAFRHLFPETDPATLSKKTERIQKLMVSAEERKKQTAQQRTGTGVRIHGGGLPYVGQQPVKAVTESTFDLVKADKEETTSTVKSGTLGQQSFPGKTVKDLEKLFKGKNLRGVVPAKISKEEFTTPLRIPPKLDKIKSSRKIEDTRATKDVTYNTKSSMAKDTTKTNTSIPTNFKKALAAGHGIYEAEGGGTVEAKTDLYGRAIDNFLKGLLPDFLGPLKKAKGKRIIR